MNLPGHRCLLGVLFVLWATVSLASTVPGQTWQDKIHPILAGHTGDEPIEFLVILKNRADLSAARGITTKEDKTTFVVERLQKVAAVTQTPLIKILEARGAEVRPFWIANAIWVRADRGTLV